MIVGVRDWACWAGRSKAQVIREWVATMVVQMPSAAEIEGLVGTRHPVAGIEYPHMGLQPYYQWLLSSLHLLAEASAGGLRVSRDDASDTTIAISPGRATLNSEVLVYPGGVSDLAVFNNDTALIWLFGAGGVATIGEGSLASGWPVGPHIKLAEVVLLAGGIDEILDRRFEAIFKDGADASVSGALASYTLMATTSGSTAIPSVVFIRSYDLIDLPLSGVDYLRVRVCDAGSYGIAANATITPGTNTTAEDVFLAGKDMALRSHTDGGFNVVVSNAIAETVTLRVGPAPLSSKRADYTAQIDITHA